MRFRMQDVVDIVEAAGVPAFVNMTGGGVATIYAGVGEPVPVLAGPGTFRGADSYAHTEDFYIGPDDEGESDPVATDSTWSVADIAAEVIRQHTERG